MKTSDKRLQYALALLCASALVLAGCDTMTSTESAPVTKAPTMSVAKADHLSQSYIQGEVDTEAVVGQRVYDFSATFAEGPRAGTTLSGTLSIELSTYGDSTLAIKLFEGTLTLSDSSVVSARGLLIENQQAYLFAAFPSPNLGLFIGQGEIAESATITGTFEGPNLSEGEAGTFTAELVE